MMKQMNATSKNSRGLSNIKMLGQKITLKLTMGLEQKLIVQNLGAREKSNTMRCHFKQAVLYLSVRNQMT
jgi:hypothetical protein